MNVATRSPPSSTIVAQPPSPSPAATCVRAILLFLSLPLYTMRHPLLNYSPLPSSPPPRPCTSVRRVFHSLSLSLALFPPPLLTHSSLSLGFVEPIRAGWSTGLSFALLHACMSRTTKRPWNYIKTIPFGWLRFCGMFAVPLSSARGFFQAD